MTDTEFRDALRRHIVAIIKLFIVRYGMTWADFMPRDVRVPQTSASPSGPIVTD